MTSTTNTQPTVSAVVVSYNYRDFVGAALDSCLSQTIPFDQVIVVDDGSTDGSIDLIESYRDRVQIVEKVNGGPLSAVWTALEAVTSDYVYVLDADDVAEPGLLAEVKPLLGQGVVKVQFQLRSIDSGGKPLDSVFPSYAQDYSSPDMLRDNQMLGFYVCAPTSGNVFRADYLRYLRDLDLINSRGAFDGVPAQVAPYFGAITSINSPLALYRVHDKSLSQWGNPTPALMDRELTRYRARWDEARSVLAASGKPAPESEHTAYVLERQLLKPVLEERRPSLRTALRYSRKIARSRVSPVQRVVLIAWALALPALPKHTANSLVVARRSPKRRNAVTRLAVTLVRAGRQRRTGAPMQSRT